VTRILDPADPRLAPYRDVGDAAALERAGLFVVEGRLTVERLLGARRFDVESIVVTPAAARAMAPALDAAGATVFVCEPAVLETITGFDFHRGCLALARRPAAPPLSSFARATRLLGVEGVGNPDNVGGIFRVAFALGAGGVLLDSASGDPYYRKAIRTSMGATLRVPFARLAPWPSGLDALRAAGFRIVALTPSADAIPIGDVAVEPDVRLILLLGSEGPGLGEPALRYADITARIPIDARADSLNVVVAAGIALHALGDRPTTSDQHQRPTTRPGQRP
jgi:tRNA G18 (ribose-2'-O)-methylase SpoU